MSKLSDTDQKIIALYKDGKTYSQIREALQIGPQRIAKVLAKNGIEKNNNIIWTDAELQILYQLYIVEKMKVRVIARSGKLPGRTEGSIATRLGKLRIENGRFVSASRDDISDDYWQRKAEEKARLAEIPQDTRGKTAYLMGDPIRERSALYQKKQAEKVVPLRRAS